MIEFFESYPPEGPSSEEARILADLSNKSSASEHLHPSGIALRARGYRPSVVAETVEVEASQISPNRCASVRAPLGSSSANTPRALS